VSQDAQEVFATQPRDRQATAEPGGEEVDSEGSGRTHAEAARRGATGLDA